MRAQALVGASALVIAGAVTACGGEESSRTSPTQPSDPKLIVADIAESSVVAEVNGVPITEECVRTQAATSGIDRRMALGECIDFELLAQAAARRGLAAMPQVVGARKTEAVRRYIDDAFTARFPDPDGTERALLQALYDKVRDRRYRKPTFRYTAFARAEVKGVEPGSPQDLAARATAEDIYAALADKRQLTAEEFRRVASEAAGDRPVSFGKPFGFPRKPSRFHRGAVESFAAATYAIPEVGMVSPPTRTEWQKNTWGWDVILLVSIEPAIDKSLDEVKDELFPVVRRRAYEEWRSQQGKGLRVQIHEDALAQLQAAEDARRFKPREVPR